MARTGSIETNNKRKRLAGSFKAKRDALSAKIKQKDLPLEERFELVMKLAKLPRNSAQIRVRNRCALDGRPRGFCRKMGISRNKLRELAAKGLLPGIVKASW
ncbi:MAG: 30S ribosomal protein S14 [Rickettsiales bacterium]|nr:MAG: 30S ribosomal protein S14 [Rickettsiales bacterium]